MLFFTLFQAHAAQDMILGLRVYIHMLFNGLFFKMELE
jgi:hypothetical protein